MVVPDSRALAQLPSLAAVAVLAVFTAAGVGVDGEQPGWVLAVLLIGGAGTAAALVRPIGLWAVVPAPPVLLVADVAVVAAVRGSSPGEITGLVASSLVRAFPQVAAAVGVALLVVLIRFARAGGLWWRARSSSTGRGGGRG